jgi:hypothetical protein
MKYTFLEEKYNRKYNESKFFEYDQFDDEDDDEENEDFIIDDRFITDYENWLNKIISRFKIDDAYKLYHFLNKSNLLTTDKKQIIKKYNSSHQNSDLLCVTILNSNGSIDILKLLLESGCDPNKYTSNKFNPRQLPLTLACSYEELEMVKLLLEYDADPYKENGELKNSIDIAFETGNDELSELFNDYLD